MQRGLQILKQLKNENRLSAHKEPMIEYIEELISSAEEE
jgi:hypothetical protein